MISAKAAPVSLSDQYLEMLRIRLFEERILAIADQGLVAGFLHPGTGQEAIAAGTLAARAPGEWVVSFYRCHGHALAAGVPAEGIAREILGRQGGLCGGKGGSMHIADRAHGFLGASSIVGTQLAVAAGVALAERTAAAGRAAIVFCGDGALGAGVSFESLTIAATLGLPLLVVCEDNGWQDHTPSPLVRHQAPARLAAGLGLDVTEADGNDVAAVHEAAVALLARCRRDRVPQVLVARTFLRDFHAMTGGQRPPEYRPEAEIAYWRERDPLDIAAARLGRPAAWFTAARERVDQELAAVFAAALAAPLPPVDSAATDVTSPGATAAVPG